ncbi:Mu transposase C-terminal domain-containing protein [Streptomyces gossypii]|uniref:Mu transposase C-terminal domain-containing protein n=1 Tax=Streptomyces gossypii TaxID=2883101 RepID=UPI002882DB9E|nr:Mu transposase C-terminal domain-containing protein [Streptomyces gossypii]
MLRPAGTKAVDASLLLAKMLVPEPLRPGWPEALAVSATLIPHARLLDIDARLEQAAAKPVIVPRTIGIDHGKVFVADVFIAACRSLGVSVQPSRPATPTDKAIVERTFSSINTLFCQHVSGYTGSNNHRAYNCPELAPLRRQPSGVAAKGGLWEVHYDPYDLSQVWVRNARTGEWITVPWTHRHLVSTPFADFTWRRARDLLAMRGQDDTNQAAVAAAVAQLLTRAENRAGPPYRGAYPRSPGVRPVCPCAAAGTSFGRRRGRGHRPGADVERHSLRPSSTPSPTGAAWRLRHRTSPTRRCH